MGAGQGLGVGKVSMSAAYLQRMLEISGREGLLGHVHF